MACNIDIANMDWEDFAEEVDRNRVLQLHA